MTASYKLTKTAEEDLGDILRFVAERDGLNRALHIHGKFVDAFEHLADAPHSGSKRTELTGEQIRWWPVFRWIVLYDAEARPLTIMRVIHGMRDLKRALLSEQK